MGLSFLALNHSSRSLSSFWLLTTQSLPYCAIIRFLLLTSYDLNQKIKNDTKVLQRYLSCDTRNIRHRVIGEAFVILQIAPLNLFVNSILPLTFHLLLLVQMDRKESTLILLRIQKQRIKKIQRTQLFFFLSLTLFLSTLILQPGNQGICREKSHNIEIKTHPTFIRPTAGN